MSFKKVDQKEYLKKYLSNDVTGEKKKKKKKKAKTSSGKSTVKIIDDDWDLKRLQNANDDEVFEAFALNEDAPQIVGIVDDRPANLIADDYKQSGKWKQMAEENESRGVKKDDDPWGKKAVSNDLSPPRGGRSKVRAASPTNSDQSPPRRHHNQDLSPVRINRQNSNTPDESPKRRRKNDSDSDESPPRRNSKREASPRGSKRKGEAASRRNRKDDSRSPERNHSRSPKRKQSRSPLKKSARRDSRSPKHTSRDSSSLKKKSRWTSRSSVDPSPPRRNKQNEDSDRKRSRSPRFNDNARRYEKSSKHSDSDDQSNRRGSDLSPPRRRNPPATSHNGSSRNKSSSSQNYQTSDLSPPRRREVGSSAPNDDLSPRRRSKQVSPQRNNRSSPRWKNDKFDDSSPPPSHRRKPFSPNRGNPSRRQSRSASPQSSGRMKKTLDGKKAGLQDARALREELDEVRRRENDMFHKLSEEQTGKNATVVSRNRRTGRIRDMMAEAAVEAEKQEKERKKKEVYDRWGKGVKQVEDTQARIEEVAHEMSKPLARYADDQDLEVHLRQQERLGDPMLDYIRQKNREKNVKAGIPVKPLYQGPFPENRYNIRPGYRWDGVDRSNGYEKKLFDVQSKKIAVQEEAYKYSCEDM